MDGISSYNDFQLADIVVWYNKSHFVEQATKKAGGWGEKI